MAWCAAGCRPTPRVQQHAGHRAGIRDAWPGRARHPALACAAEQVRASECHMSKQMRLNAMFPNNWYIGNLQCMHRSCMAMLCLHQCVGAAMQDKRNCVTNVQVCGVGGILASQGTALRRCCMSLAPDLACSVVAAACWADDWSCPVWLCGVHQLPVAT